MAGQLDMQASVAVDHVVTAAPGEEVTTATAEQDVAARERHRPFWEVVGQARDQVDIRQLVEGVDLGVVGALDEVVELRAACRFGLDEEVADSVAAERLWLVDELASRHVDADTVVLVLPRCPVEVAQHDVVAAEALHAVAAEPAVEDVVALDQRHLAGGCALVTDNQIAADATLDPVVAFVALDLVVILAAEDDVIAEPAEDVVDALAAIDVVIAIAAEHDVGADPGADGVVARVTPDGVIARRVGDGVVAGSAVEEIVAVVAVYPVIAAVAPDGVVVGLSRQKPVITLGAAQHHRIAEEVIVTDEVDSAVGQDLDQLRPGHRIVQPGRRIGRDPVAVRVEDEVAVGVALEVGRGLDSVFRREKDAGAEMLSAGVLHDQLGERVGLDLAAEVDALDARQVVEPVAILQVLELVLEDEVERRAEQAAEQVLLLGQAADPKIDVVEPCDRTCAPLRMHGERIGEIVSVGPQAVHEIVSVLVGCVAGLACRIDAHRDEIQRRSALAGQCALPGDRGMGAVGRDEIDDRGVMLQEQAEFVPVRVRLEIGVVRLAVDLVADQVDRRHAGVAATRDVESGEVERQPQQVVAQGPGHELVDL